jgi:hypothetical protein
MLLSPFCRTQLREGITSFDVTLEGARAEDSFINLCAHYAGSAIACSDGELVIKEGPENREAKCNNRHRCKIQRHNGVRTQSGSVS